MNGYHDLSMDLTLRLAAVLVPILGLTILFKEAAWVIWIFSLFYLMATILAISVNYSVLRTRIRGGGWLVAVIVSHIAFLFAISFQCDLSEGNNVWLVLPALIYGTGTWQAHPSQWLPQWLLSLGCTAKSCMETCSPMNDLIAFIPWGISLLFVRWLAAENSSAEY